MPPLKEQLRQLIDSVYDGSVNAAARDIGLPQATLARMVDGRVTNPKTDSLQKIGAHFGASIDWLLTGTGAGPDPAAGAWGFGGEVARRWTELVDSLGLEDSAKGALMNLPGAVKHATLSMPRTRSPRDVDFEQMAKEQEPLYRAARLEKEAWTIVLSTWIDWWGVDAVRAALQSPEGIERLWSRFRTGQVLNNRPEFHPSATPSPASKRPKATTRKPSKRGKARD